MNWKRGLVRTWIVVAVIWVAVASAKSAPVLADPVHNGARFQLAEARAAGYSDREISAYLRRREVWHFIEFGLAPPLALLAGGVAVSWVVRGFRPKPA